MKTKKNCTFLVGSYEERKPSDETLVTPQNEILERWDSNGSEYKKMIILSKII